jgi:predicted RND superfamily exporter protein
MKRLADFIIRYRTAVVATVGLLTLFLGYEATKIELNADFSSYLRQDDPLVQEYEYIGEQFGGNSIGIALVTSPDVFSRETLTLVKELTEAYQSVEGISYVTSLTNVVDFKKTEWGLEVGKLLNQGELPQTQEELERLRAYVMSKDRYVGNLVSDDGTTTAILLRFNSGPGRALAHFSTALRVKAASDQVVPPDSLPEGTKIYYGGMPFLIYNMTLLISENMMVLDPLIVLVLLLVLWLGFRRLGGVLMPLTVVLVSVIWTVGLMGLFGLKMDLLSGIMPVILVALGSADGIHLMKRYYERRRSGDNPAEAAKGTYQEMGVPIVLTTITTMVGFASLAISDFSVIRQFGVITAVGILLALLVTLTLLPALLSFSKDKPFVEKAKKTASRGFMSPVARFVHRRKFAVLTAGLAVVILAVIAIPRIVKDVDWSLCLQKGSEPFHAEMLLREKFGGSLPVQILVRGDLKDPAVLKKMRDIERYSDTVPLVSKPQSIASIVAEMNEVMNDRYVVPETRQGVSNLWFLVEGEEMMEQMVANEDREGLITAKLGTWHTGSLVAVVDSINAFLSRLPSRFAVIDQREAPEELRPTLLELRKEAILTRLQWDLARREIDVDRTALRQVVDKLAAGVLQPSDWDVVAAKITEYLLSPEAEIPFTSRSRAQRLARSLVAEVRKSGDLLSEEAIQRLILRQIPAANRDDAEYLAGSLKELVRVEIGTARVRPAFASLLKLLPASGAADENVRRDLEGDLWEINENLLVLDWPQYEQIVQGQALPSVREVEVTFSQTGIAPVLNQMEAELTPTQVESVLTALVFVIILLAIIFRSAVGGLLAVVPISVTIMVNFAVMGYLGIGLDSFTAMVASIAIGLGIDYAIHFTHRFRSELEVDGDEVAALERTLGTTGVAILVNALSVGLGFMVLLAAGGQHIRRFGGLTALTMFVSALFTLTILPSLFLWLKPKFLQRAEEAGVRRAGAELSVSPAAARG